MENNRITDPGGDDLKSSITGDLFNLTGKHVDATQGQRFVNFLIDYLFTSYALGWLGGYVAGLILTYTAPDFLQRIVYEESSTDSVLFFLMVAYMHFLLYYTFCEKVSRGHTLGKLLTGTRAIREDGRELTFKDAILRSLSRIVPFEVFSGLGVRPWHDSWTKTRVIKTR